MSFLNRIFSNRRSISQETPPKKGVEGKAPSPVAQAPQEFAKLIAFSQTLNALLMSDKYLARSDYKQLVENYAGLNSFFQNLRH